MSVIELADEDLAVYADGIDIRVYPWGDGVVTDTEEYYDGHESLKFTYSFSNFWAGFGFGLTGSGNGIQFKP
ncbi:MAG: hypothetical protein JXB03_09915 [Spirochaetales bacterium]|nr:hypothetical protein [Spirochaetales bacterium]